MWIVCASTLHFLKYVSPSITMTVEYLLLILLFLKAMDMVLLVQFHDFHP